MSETRVESCDHCDAGWAEGAPVPALYGPHYSYSQCGACDGKGVVEIKMLPIALDDLDEMCGDYMEVPQ